LVRAVLWFRCAAMHDPVRPVVAKPAVLGWIGKNRNIDLVIERPLRAPELLGRMKGWFTADVHLAVKIVEQYGRLKLLDDYELVVETENTDSMENLEKVLKENFNNEVWIEILEKKRI